MQLILCLALATLMIALLPNRLFANEPISTPGPTISSRDDAGCNRARFKIAIDVGHTIDAPGATSSRGLSEYSFNLKLATQIKSILADAGYIQTRLLVVRGVGRSQLISRVERANALAVDLFVSIHHDDVQNVFYQKWTFDGRTRVYSDRFSGHSIFVSYDNKALSESIRFANLLGQALLAGGMHFTTHHAEDIPGERRPLVDPQRGIYRYDQLVVLKQNRAPSILLEAGIIVNRTEELLLASVERQRSIGSALLAAVDKFCSSRP